MLSKKHRLPRKDFLLVKKHGKKFSAPNFSAVVFFHPLILPLLPSRFCVITSTKFSKSAVVRNRFRRQIYDSLETDSYQLKANVILYPKPSVLNLTHEELHLEVDNFLSKIRT